METIVKKRKEEIVSHEAVHNDNPLMELYEFGKYRRKKQKSTKQELKELRKELEPISKWW